MNSVPTFAVLCIVAVPLVLLRLFGYLFFASTTSTWAIVPALVLGSLIPVAVKPFSRRGAVAIALGTGYLCSVLFHGWADLQFRLSEGQSGVFDGVEALLILILMARCSTHPTDDR
jgi:hypothetical protein